MIREPKVEVRAEQPYVAIPIKTTLKEWGRANALVGEVFEWMAQKGIALAGPPFFRYWVIGDMDEEFDLEVGAPVASAVTGDGRVIAGSIPGGSYATLMHTGHPDGLFNGLAEFEDWARGQGLEWANRMDGNSEVWGGRFEVYLTDPAEQPDLEKWLIEVAYLIRDGAAEAGAGAQLSSDELKNDLPTGLSKPAQRALAGAGFERLEQFTTVSEAEVLKLHGMEPKALEPIRRALAARGLSFADGP